MSLFEPFTSSCKKTKIKSMTVSGDFTFVLNRIAYKNKFICAKTAEHGSTKTIKVSA